MVQKFKTEITREDKRKLEDALNLLGMMPPAQGTVVLNISPDKTISSVEYKMIFR